MPACLPRLDLPGASCVELSVSILAASFDMAQSYVDTLSEYKVALLGRSFGYSFIFAVRGLRKGGGAEQVARRVGLH